MVYCISYSEQGLE